MFGVEEIQSPSAPTTSQSWRSLLTPHSPPCFHFLAVCFVYDDMCVTSSAAESLQQKKKKRKKGNKLWRLFPEYNLRNFCWEGNKTSTLKLNTCSITVHHIIQVCVTLLVLKIAQIELHFFPEKNLSSPQICQKKAWFILLIFLEFPLHPAINH